ncbi:MAG: hypothetical protein V5A32_03445 [Halovenus sp.]
MMPVIAAKLWAVTLLNTALAAVAVLAVFVGLDRRPPVAAGLGFTTAVVGVLGQAVAGKWLLVVTLAEMKSLGMAAAIGVSVLLATVKPEL